MKRLTLLLLLISSSVFSQNLLSSTGSSNENHELNLEKGDELFQVKMLYGSAKILNLEELRKLKYQLIKKIELVYTKYSEVEGFDQTKLNEQRLANLKKVDPKLFKNSMTAYKEVGVIDCTSPEDGRKIFHGFNIVYRPIPSLARTEKEIEGLMKLLEELEKKDEEADEENIVEAADGEPITVTEVAKMELIDSKKEGPWKRYKKGKSTDIVEWTDVEGTYSAPVSVGTLDKIAKEPVTEKKKEWLGRSTVGKVMERHPEWDDMLVVVDVTGSMYSYIGQIMLWLKLNEKQDRTKQHVFFNDGDTKPQFKKVVGNTGGVYITDKTKFDEVLPTTLKAMRSGGGGDAPENNLEATIKGLKTCTDCKDIIMIADNWATPRDVKLYKEIGKPVRIILCGSSMGINVQYLNLAKKLKGSVHTMEKDLEDLAELNEGETVEIAGRIYKIVDGEFILAPRT